MSDIKSKQFIMMKTIQQRQLSCLTVCVVVIMVLSGQAYSNGHQEMLGGGELSHYERKIVASCLVLEAASDGELGMQAVLNVIYNRAEKNVNRVLKEVVKPKQFSCFNSVTGRPNPDFSQLIKRALYDPMFNQAYQLVIKMEHDELIDNTFGADHYHATTLSVFPYWAEAMRITNIVGGHIFYTSKEEPVETIVAAVDLPKDSEITQ